MTPPFSIKGIDHLALSVRDLDASVNFYHNILGLELLNQAEYQAGTRSFLSVRLGHSLIDLFPANHPDVPTTRGTLNHFCVYVETGLDWTAFKDYVQLSGLDIKREILHNWGSFGYGDSIYINDPDGNSVELKKYPADLIG